MSQSFYCKHCNTQNDSDDIYCARCGRKLLQTSSTTFFPKAIKALWITAFLVILVLVADYLIYKNPTILFPSDSTSHYDSSQYIESIKTTATPKATVSSASTAFFPIGHYCYIPDDGNNVRSGPGTDYAIVGQVNTGERYMIHDSALGSTGVDWYKIKVNGTYGWLSSRLVIVEGITDGTIYGEPVGGV